MNVSMNAFTYTQHSFSVYSTYIASAGVRGARAHPILCVKKNTRCLPRVREQNMKRLNELKEGKNGKISNDNNNMKHQTHLWATTKQNAQKRRKNKAAAKPT